MKITDRLPGWKKIAPVYAVIVVMVYSWSILWFFWKAPSWAYFLTTGELVSLLSFTLATNLLESLAVLLAFLLACVLLPKAWFHEAFVARGAALAITGLGYMMLLANQFQIKADYPGDWLNWTPAVLAGILVIAFVIGWLPFTRKVMEALAERMTVFLYVSLPLSLLALAHAIILIIT